MYEMLAPGQARRTLTVQDLTQMEDAAADEEEWHALTATVPHQAEERSHVSRDARFMALSDLVSPNRSLTDEQTFAWPRASALQKEGDEEKPAVPTAELFDNHSLDETICAIAGERSRHIGQPDRLAGAAMLDVIFASDLDCGLFEGPSDAV